MPYRLSVSARNIRLDAQRDLLNSGYLRIYSGSQPATPATAITGQVLLAELRFANPSAPNAANGVLSFSAIVKDSSANATGTATWFRALQSDGSTAVMDGTVGTVGANLNFSSVNFTSGAEITVSSLVLTDPMES